MKKLIFIIIAVVFLCINVNAQKIKYYGKFAMVSSLYTSLNKPVYTLGGFALSVPSGKYTLTQTGAEVQVILDMFSTVDRLNAAGSTLNLSVNGILHMFLGANLVQFSVKAIPSSEGNVDLGQTNRHWNNSYLNNIWAIGSYNFGADAQADDDYEISLSGFTALATAMTVTFTATTANTDGATLEITEIGDIDALLKGDGNALATGDITAGLPITAFFNAAGNWIIMSRLASD